MLPKLAQDDSFLLKAIEDFKKVWIESITQFEFEFGSVTQHINS